MMSHYTFLLALALLKIYQVCIFPLLFFLPTPQQRDAKKKKKNTI